MQNQYQDWFRVYPLQLFDWQEQYLIHTNCRWFVLVLFGTAGADFMKKRSILGKQCLIIVRTTLGRIYQNKKLYRFCRPPCAVPGCCEMDHCKQHGDLYESVVSNDPRGLLPREFIVFDGAQLYPELVVTFQVLPSCIKWYLHCSPTCKFISIKRLFIGLLTHEYIFFYGFCCYHVWSY